MLTKKKLLAGSLVLGMMLPASVFAEEPVESEQSTIIQENESINQISDEDKATKILAIVEARTPDQLDAWNAAIEARKEAKEKLQENLEVQKQEFEDEKQLIKDQIKNGEIAREEGQEAIKQLCEEYIANRSAQKEDNEQLHEEHRQQMEELKASLDNAVANDDEATITSTLSTMLDEYTAFTDQLESNIAE
ncbi:hypothetical protein [Cytobacillus sp. IB215316]|uniref:hypothetical protein n=1 Tax=Cytobacillus sp. IB215316 TaxID=3097354 RepID=UPI002A100A09|nr:hypothetical protein [Cytobacillus sp. IB215316]MDX8361160.1 hypothetical protein [Cytobacillus sp. IB215316]